MGRRAVAAVAGVAGAVFAAAAAVASGAAAVSGLARGDGALLLDRGSAVPGETASVTGEHAEPGAVVAIHFADAQGAVVTTKAGRDGRYGASFTIPEGAGIGWHPVTAMSRGSTLATTEIRVVDPADEAASDGWPVLPGLVLSTALLGLAIAVAVARGRGDPTPP